MAFQLHARDLPTDEEFTQFLQEKIHEQKEGERQAQEQAQEQSRREDPEGKRGFGTIPSF